MNSDDHQDQMACCSGEACLETRSAIAAAADSIAIEATRPSVLYRPRVYIDGNKWCALYGDDVQGGVAGFGDSPEEAMADFDTHWRATIGEAT